MTAQTAITLFNRRTGGDRNDLYYPTRINGVSFLESRGSSHGTDGAHSENLSYKIRIPYRAEAEYGKKYKPEKAYRNLGDVRADGYWTLQKGDIILPEAVRLNRPVTRQELRELADAAELDLITIAEYADNTIRGSDAVKHWRIGGE